MTDLTKTIRTITTNINGLNNDNKRSEFFQILHNKKFDIIFIQETHTKVEMISKIKKEWNGKQIWHSGSNAKNSGVSILFSKLLNINFLKTEKSLDGRMIKCLAQIENQIFQLINVYTPTNPKDRLTFLKELQKIIEKKNNTILAGDFNMLEDILLDKIGGNTSNTHLIGLNILTEIKNQNNLIDIWRKINPDKRMFTYHNPDKTIHTRLDRIYMTNNMVIKKSTIYPISLSDHDGVTVSFQIGEINPKGPGIWKLNTSILKHKNFQEIFKSFWTYWQKQKRKYDNQLLWWDAGKLYLKTIIIEYCTKRNKEINQKQQTLIENITKEKSKINSNIEIINKYQQELNEIENYTLTGTIIRSKEKIILNEEKPTKFFYSQEKQKQIKKSIQIIIDEEENILQNNEDILKECKKFYENLYKKNLPNNLKFSVRKNRHQNLRKPKSTAKQTNRNTRNKNSNRKYGK